MVFQFDEFGLHPGQVPERCGDVPARGCQLGQGRPGPGVVQHGTLFGEGGSGLFEQAARVHVLAELGERRSAQGERQRVLPTGDKAQCRQSVSSTESRGASVVQAVRRR